MPLQKSYFLFLFENRQYAGAWKRVRRATTSHFPVSLVWLTLQPIDQFLGKWYPILDPTSLIYIPYPRVNCLKTIPFTAARTYHSPYMAAPPYPPGTTTATCCSECHVTLIKPLIKKAAEMNENLCKQISLEVIKYLECDPDAFVFFYIFPLPFLLSK